MLQGQAGNPARGMADLLPCFEQHLLGLAASAVASTGAARLPSGASSAVQPLLDALLAADAGPPPPLRAESDASPAAQHAAQAAAAAAAGQQAQAGRHAAAAAGPAAAEIPFWGPPPQLSQPPRLPQRPTQLLPGHAFSEFLSPEGEEASGASHTALALLPFSHDHPGQWVG